MERHKWLVPVGYIALFLCYLLSHFFIGTSTRPRPVIIHLQPELRYLIPSFMWKGLWLLDSTFLTHKYPVFVVFLLFLNCFICWNVWIWWIVSDIILSIGNGNKQLFDLIKQELQERLIGLHKASTATATKLVKCLFNYIVP